MKTAKSTLTSFNQTFVVCDFCGQKEKGKGYLQRHIDRKHRKFFCNVCNQVYSLKNNLLNHLRNHFERFICQYCGLEIVRFEQFQKHVYQKHEPNNKQLILSIQSKETYGCRHCLRTFPTAVHRNCHETSVHKGRTEEAFKCSECSRVFITKDELRSHSFEHYFGALFFCAFTNCDRFFKSKKQLANHNFIHGPANHECPNCHKRFSQSTNLSKHKKICKANNQAKILLSKEDQEAIVDVAKKQFEQLCGKLQLGKRKIAISRLKISEKKIKTIKRSSAEVVEYLEEFSDEVVQEIQKLKSVSSNDEKNYSRNTKTPKIDSTITSNYSTRTRSSRILAKNFVCDVCAFQTNSERNLNSHLRSHRLEKSLERRKEAKSDQNQSQNSLTKNLTLSCDLCEFVSKSKRQMRNHVHRHRTFECSLCGFNCKRSSILKNHMKIHETPTECQICHKFLPNMTRHLKWHLRLKSDPFKCPQCGKLCSTKQTVQEHIHRIHEKMPLGKTYTCGLCDLNFIRNNDLRRHSFIHYTGRIYNCFVPGCHEMFKTSFKLQEHAKVHNPLKEATFACNLCEKKYQRKTALSKHKKIIHGNITVKLSFDTS